MGDVRRTTATKTETHVRYVATPSSGRERANPPNLGDLRKFVAACDGLPDDLHVTIDKGHLNEAGRHDVTFSVRQIIEEGDPVDTAEPEMMDAPD